MMSDDNENWDIQSWDEKEESNTQDGIEITPDVMLKGRSMKAYIKNMETSYIRASELNKVSPPPKPGEQYRIITEKQFNAFSLILAVIEKQIIEELWIAIYRINQPTVYAIIDMIEKGLIKKGGFVISNFFNQTKRPEVWANVLLEYCESNPNFKHVYTHNHSKVVIMKIQNNYYVMEGSGNMSDNARIEQYLYENNKASFEFHKEWMNDVFEKSTK